MGIFDFWKKKKPSQLSGGHELPSHGERRQIKLGIIVGHDSKAQGAEMPDGTSEYKFNSEVAELMAKECVRVGAIVPVIIKRDGTDIAGTYKQAEDSKCDAVIELHFNAFNGTASGSEVLSTPDSNDIDFAQIILNAVCSVFERQGSSRGIKTLSRSGRGGGNVHGFPNGTNCLVEPFFGDNPREANMAMARKADYASGLVNAVLVWARKRNLVD